MKQDYFSSRSTVREYAPTEVTDSLLREIVEAAVHAPTCGNMQLYTVIATRDVETKTKLAELHFNQPAATGAPLILTVCADFNRFTRWCELSDADPGYDNFHSFVVALTDAVILTQQIVTIAEMRGLGTCYLGTVNYNAEAISDLLQLPELVVPVASISIGFKAAEGDKAERLPVDTILHFEHYRHDSDETLMEQFKAKDDYPANKEFVALNGKKSLAQIFTDIRYPRAMNEEVSRTFMKLVLDKGYKK